MKRALVLLSGCGNMDGSEIHESVAALIALDQLGWEVVFTAPATSQSKTVDYVTKTEIEPRNALKEAARIARGRIFPLDDTLLDDADALVIPGGLGAATTLCSFAAEGSSCKALPEVRSLLETARERGIPIAAMCIAPALVARCLPGTRLTIGHDPSTAALIEEMGCTHVTCAATEAFIDAESGVITTPAYMSAKGPAEVFRGASEMVRILDSITGGDRKGPQDLS